MISTNNQLGNLTKSELSLHIFRVRIRKGDKSQLTENLLAMDSWHKGCFLCNLWYGTSETNLIQITWSSHSFINCCHSAVFNIYSKGKRGRKRQNKVNLFAIKNKEKTFKTNVADAIISLTQENVKQFLTWFFTCVVVGWLGFYTHNNRNKEAAKKTPSTQF